MAVSSVVALHPGVLPNSSHDLRPRCDMDMNVFPAQILSCVMATVMFDSLCETSSSSGILAYLIRAALGSLRDSTPDLVIMWSVIQTVRIGTGRLIDTSCTCQRKFSH